MRQRDCRKAVPPHTNVSKGRLLGRAANAGGTAECGAPTARGRAVCGKTACTVLRGEAGNGVGSWGPPSLKYAAWTAPDQSATAPVSYSTRACPEPAEGTSGFFLAPLVLSLSKDR